MSKKQLAENVEVYYQITDEGDAQYPFATWKIGVKRDIDRNLPKSAYKRGQPEYKRINIERRQLNKAIASFGDYVSYIPEECGPYGYYVDINNLTEQQILDAMAKFNITMILHDSF